MYSTDFLDKFKVVLETTSATNTINHSEIEMMAGAIKYLKETNGRLFIIGIGGSAANASHAASDFRKLCNIEAYAPTDNVAELTARINDSKEGWYTVFRDWLEVSKLSSRDAVLILSVGGGSVDTETSRNFMPVCLYAQKVGADIFSIVGKNGGFVKAKSSYCIHIPEVYPELVTPITEAMQSIILHLLASHPMLQENPTKW